MAAREIMDSVGVGQKYCNEIIGKAQTIGNNLGLPQPALEDTLEGLEEDIEDVRLTDRLTDSACVLVASDTGLGAHMERMMAAMGRDLPVRKRILELNPKHPVLAKLKGLVEADAGAEIVGDYADLLHGQGLISEGSALKDPQRFTQLVSRLMAG